MALDFYAPAFGGWVQDFVRRSNAMAGITRDPTAAEVAAHRGLLAANALAVDNLVMFVRHIERGAVLRSEDTSPLKDRAPDIRAELDAILAEARTLAAPPDRLHRDFEALRPFTDGNGRCGRALLLWRMIREIPAGGVTDLMQRLASKPAEAGTSRASIH
jgi:hypothetical protein